MKLEFSATIDVEAESPEAAIAVLQEKILKIIGAELISARKQTSRRTRKQNNSIHLYFRQLADALNASGYDMKKTLRAEIDIPWSEYSVKESLWRPTQEVLYGKESTKELTTEDVSKIYDIVDRAISERTGVHVPFPDIELLLGK